MDDEGRRVRLSFRLPFEVCEQISTIARELNIPRTAVVSQAVARWYNTDSVFEGAKAARCRDNKNAAGRKEEKD